MTGNVSDRETGNVSDSVTCNEPNHWQVMYEVLSEIMPYWIFACIVYQFPNDSDLNDSQKQ